MVMSFSWMRSAFVAILLGLTVSACGYNTIPTLEEQAKAKWADVQNNYQRRADLIPNLVATVQGYAKQEKDVLTAVVEARAKATQIKIDVSRAHRPRQAEAVPGRAEPAVRRARAAARGQRELSRPQVEPELPRAAIAARRHREPHRRGAARLHRGGAGLQHRAEDLPRHALGDDLLPRQQADGRIHRQRRRADAAAGEVLTRADATKAATCSQAISPRTARCAERGSSLPSPRCC